MSKLGLIRRPWDKIGRNLFYGLIGIRHIDGVTMNSELVKPSGTGGGRGIVCGHATALSSVG